MSKRYYIGALYDHSKSVVRHWGLPGMKWYEHKYGPWQKQAQYANGMDDPNADPKQRKMVEKSCKYAMKVARSTKLTGNKGIDISNIAHKLNDIQTNNMVDKQFPKVKECAKSILNQWNDIYKTCTEELDKACSSKEIKKELSDAIKEEAEVVFGHKGKITDPGFFHDIREDMFYNNPRAIEDMAPNAVAKDLKMQETGEKLLKYCDSEAEKACGSLGNTVIAQTKNYTITYKDVLADKAYMKLAGSEVNYGLRHAYADALYNYEFDLDKMLSLDEYNSRFK